MKTYDLPASFDGVKLAKRYGLNPGLTGDAEFWVCAGKLHVGKLKLDGEGNIVRNKDKSPVYDDIMLPDDPPIFEAPDTKPVEPTDAFAAIDGKRATSEQVAEALHYWRKTGRL